MGMDILGIDIMGVDILGIDIPAPTLIIIIYHQIHTLSDYIILNINVP